MQSPDSEKVVNYLTAHACLFKSIKSQAPTRVAVLCLMKLIIIDHLDRQDWFKRKVMCRLRRIVSGTTLFSMR